MTHLWPYLHEKNLYFVKKTSLMCLLKKKLSSYFRTHPTTLLLKVPPKSPPMPFPPLPSPLTPHLPPPLSPPADTTSPPDTLTPPIFPPCPFLVHLVG